MLTDNYRNEILDLVTELKAHLKDPKQFTSILYQHIDEKSVKVHHPGIYTPRMSYNQLNTPLPYIRMICRYLSKTFRESPFEVLDTIEELWNTGYYELKYVAGILLGEINTDFDDKIIELIKTWFYQLPDPSITNILIINGCNAMIINKSEKLIQLIGDLLVESEVRIKKIGLQLSYHLVKDVSFEDYHLIFKNIEIGLIDIKPELRSSINKLMKTLIREAPVETLTFIKHRKDIGNPLPKWLLRRIES